LSVNVHDDFELGGRVGGKVEGSSGDVFAEVHARCRAGMSRMLGDLLRNHARAIVIGDESKRAEVSDCDELRPRRGR
jgi:hypothetical protein